MFFKQEIVHSVQIISYPVGIYMFKVKNRNTRIRWEVKFKVNNKDNRMMPVASFWCLYS